MDPQQCAAPWVLPMRHAAHLAGDLTVAPAFAVPTSLLRPGGGPMQAHALSFEQLDRNGDGVLSREEFAQVRVHLPLRPAVVPPSTLPQQPLILRGSNVAAPATLAARQPSPVRYGTTQHRVTMPTVVLPPAQAMTVPLRPASGSTAPPWPTTAAAPAPAAPAAAVAAGPTKDLASRLQSAEQHFRRMEHEWGLIQEELEAMRSSHRRAHSAAGRARLAPRAQRRRPQRGGAGPQRRC